MLYPLWHWLFGWDYIHWKNNADQGIARVRVDHLGYVYYWRYRTITLADRIQKPEEVMWLTCHPAKYFPFTYDAQPRVVSAAKI